MPNYSETSVVKTFDLALKEKYRTNNFSPDQFNIDIGDKYPFNKICRWDKKKNKIFTVLFYKDVNSGDIFLINE